MIAYGIQPPCWATVPSQHSCVQGHLDPGQFDARDLQRSFWVSWQQSSGSGTTIWLGDGALCPIRRDAWRPGRVLEFAPQSRHVGRLRCSPTDRGHEVFALALQQDQGDGRRAVSAKERKPSLHGLMTDAACQMCQEVVLSALPGIHRSTQRGHSAVVVPSVGACTLNAKSEALGILYPSALWWGEDQLQAVTFAAAQLMRRLVFVASAAASKRKASRGGAHPWLCRSCRDVGVHATAIAAGLLGTLMNSPAPTKSAMSFVTAEALHVP